MKQITLDSLKIFFQERPSLSKRGVEREAGLPDSKLKEYLRGKQDLSNDQKNRLLQVLTNYGWSTKAKGLAGLLIDYSPIGVSKKQN